MQVSGIVEQSFTAWPGRPAAVLYFAGSPYARNCWHYPVLERHPLAVKHSSKDAEKTLRVIEEQTNRKRISAVVLGGAEPLLQPDLPDFCKRLKKLRLDIRLETFGSSPAMLRQLLDGRLVDFVSLRVKTVFAQYKGLFGQSGEPVKESYALLAASGIPYEVCVTLVPGLVEEKDIKTLLWTLQEARQLVLEQFDPPRCVEPALKGTPKPTAEELRALAERLEFGGRVLLRADGRETEVRKMVVLA